MGIRGVGVCCVRVVKTRNITCALFCVVKIIFLFAVCFSLLDGMGVWGDDERGRTEQDKKKLF